MKKKNILLGITALLGVVALTAWFIANGYLLSLIPLFTGIIILSIWWGSPVVAAWYHRAETAAQAQIKELLQEQVLDVRGAFELLEQCQRHRSRDNNGEHNLEMKLLRRILATLDSIEAGNIDFCSAIRGWFDSGHVSGTRRWYDKTPSLSVKREQIHRLQVVAVTQMCLAHLNAGLYAELKEFVAQARARYDEHLFEDMKLEPYGQGFGRVTGFRLNAERKRVAVSMILLDGRDAEIPVARLPKGSSQSANDFMIGDGVHANIAGSTTHTPIRLSLDCCLSCGGLSNVEISLSPDEFENNGRGALRPLCKSCRS